MFRTMEPFRIMVANKVAGTGKTTTALGLAGAFANLGLKVLLLDLAFERTATQLLLGDATSRTLLDLANTDNPLSDVILHTPSGFDLIAGHATWDADAKENIHFRLASRLGDAAALGYHLVLIDTPPFHGTSALSCRVAVSITSELVLPYTMAPNAEQGQMDSTIDSLNLAAMYLGRPVVHLRRAIQVGFDGRFRSSTLALQELVKRRWPHAASIGVRVHSSLEGNGPLAALPNSVVAEDYRCIAEGMLDDYKAKGA